MAVFWWTKSNGSYGRVDASSAAEARRKKPGAKIHAKPPYSWLSPSPRRTSRKVKKAPAKKTSRPRKAPAKKTSRKRITNRPAPRKQTAAPKESRSETNPEQQAIADTHRLLAQWKVPGYTAVFSNKLTSSMGNVNHRSKVVKYSRPIWQRATPDERKNTVIHEVAHAVVAHFHGRQPGVSHGAKWKRQMRAMGVKKPQRCHRVSTKGLGRTRSDTVAIRCCGGEHRMTIKRLRRALAAGGHCLCRGGGKDKIQFATQADKDRFERSLMPNVVICGLQKR